MFKASKCDRVNLLQFFIPSDSDSGSVTAVHAGPQEQGALDSSSPSLSVNFDKAFPKARAPPHSEALPPVHSHVPPRPLPTASAPPAHLSAGRQAPRRLITDAITTVLFLRHSSSRLDSPAWPHEGGGGGGGRDRDAAARDSLGEREARSRVRRRARHAGLIGGREARSRVRRRARHAGLIGGREARSRVRHRARHAGLPRTPGLVMWWQ